MQMIARMYINATSDSFFLKTNIKRLIKIKPNAVVRRNPVFLKCDIGDRKYVPRKIPSIKQENPFILDI